MFWRHSWSQRYLLFYQLLLLYLVHVKMQVSLFGNYCRAIVIPRWPWAECVGVIVLQEAGEEPPEAVTAAAEDIEAAVTAAVAAVPKPPAAEVTDGDVLSALMEQGVVTKDAIVQALALHALEAELGG
jgi:hypothetical protein